MIRMVAVRRYYRAEDRREYMPGEQFTVASEREAAMLAMRRRARLADRAMTAEAPIAGPAELEAPAPAPRRRGRPPKYARRDMRPED